MPGRPRRARGRLVPRRGRLGRPRRASPPSEEEEAGQSAGDVCLLCLCIRLCLLPRLPRRLVLVPEVPRRSPSLSDAVSARGLRDPLSPSFLRPRSSRRASCAPAGPPSGLFKVASQSNLWCDGARHRAVRRARVEALLLAATARWGSFPERDDVVDAAEVGERRERGSTPPALGRGDRASSSDHRAFPARPSLRPRRRPRPSVHRR